MMDPDKRNPHNDNPAGVTEPLLSIQNPKGGFRTLPSTIGTEAFEKVATLGLMPNMILYLTREYGMGNIEGANILFIWSAASNFTPVLGAFLADSYVGRFRMIAFGSIFSLVGLVALWLTAMIPQARPPPCSNEQDQYSNSIYCDKTATTPQLILLYSSFVLMSIGSGGVRSSAMAFGADQLASLRKRQSKAGGEGIPIVSKIHGSPFPLSAPDPSWILHRLYGRRFGTLGISFDRELDENVEKCREEEEGDKDESLKTHIDSFRLVGFYTDPTITKQ